MKKKKEDSENEEEKEGRRILRIRGTTQKQVKKQFEEVERPALQPLPPDRFPFSPRGAAEGPSGCPRRGRPVLLLRPRQELLDQRSCRKAQGVIASIYWSLFSRLGMIIRPVLAALCGGLLGCASASESSPACAQYSLAMMGREGEVLSGMLLVSSRGTEGPGEIQLLPDGSKTGKLASLLRRKLTAGQGAITLYRKERGWVVRLLPDVIDDEVLLDGRWDGEGVTGSITHATEAGPERAGWFVAVCRR